MANILICDDERDIVSALKLYLAPEGYTRSTVPVKVEVEAFKSTEYEWKNGQNATLTIIKRDKETKTPLANATFEVRSPDGTLGCYPDF